MRGLGIYAYLCVCASSSVFVCIVNKFAQTFFDSLPSCASALQSTTNWVESHTTSALFARHTLSPACCKKAKITMLCLTTPAWMQTDPHSTCGGLDDSLTEKRRDSHIFPGPEIHYTVTRTARAVMVNMFRNTETLEQTNQRKQYLSITTAFLLLKQLYAPHPT